MHRNTRIGLLAASCLALSLAATAAAAARVRVDTWLHGVADASSTTFATTSYADLTGATVSFVPRFDYSTVDAPGTPTKTPYIKATFTATMSKATATTGTCALYANGAVVAKTAQTITTAATNGNVSGVWMIPDALTATQTVKIQCKSADTNVLTVSAGHLIVEEVR